MMKEPQIVTSFVLYEGEKILCQCDFQSFETHTTNTFLSTEGDNLKVTHFYNDLSCTVAVQYLRKDLEICSLDLDIPINRTKIKWKQRKFGERYNLFYRTAITR